MNTPMDEKSIDKLLHMSGHLLPLTAWESDVWEVSEKDLDSIKIFLKEKFNDFIDSVPNERLFGFYKSLSYTSLEVVVRGLKLIGPIIKKD